MKLTKTELGIAAIAHKGKHRYAFNSVQVNEQEGRLVATDGRRMLIMELPPDPENPVTQDLVCIPAPELRDLAKLVDHRRFKNQTHETAELVQVNPDHEEKPASTVWQVSKHPTRKRPRWADMRITIETNPDAFPPWECVKPKAQRQVTISVNGDKLAELLATMHRIAREWAAKATPLGVAVPEPTIHIGYHGKGLAITLVALGPDGRKLLGFIMPKTPE